MEEYPDDPFVKIDTERSEVSSYPRVIIVRHAESVANGSGIYQGQSYDRDLSTLGRKQAVALAKRLSPLTIAKIISSPLKRSYQTALEISKLTNIEIQIAPLIMETNHGAWEGMSKENIKREYKNLHEMWLRQPSRVSFPGGESFMDTVRRVETFLESGELTDGSVVVSHDNIVRIIACKALGFPYDDIWRHEIEPAAINVFELMKAGGRVKLRGVAINDVTHLYGIRADTNKHAL